MKRYVVKQIEKLNVPVKAADLNGDDKVNSTDYSVLKRYLLRSIEVIPIK